MVVMRAVMIAILTTGCYQAAPATSPPAIAPVAPAAAAPGPQPRVRLASLFWGDDGSPAALDNESLEGWPAYAYTNLPAVSADGSLIAVVEERDGDGHRPVPGIRILSARGGTHAWFPLVPPAPKPGSPGEEAEMLTTFKALVDAANRELGARTWIPLRRPPAAKVSEAGRDRTVTWDIGRHTLVHELADYDEARDWGQPPTRIVVLDATGAEVLALPETRTSWDVGGGCNFRSWSLVGVREEPGIALYQLELGMGGHDCDGVVQPHDWRVVAF